MLTIQMSISNCLMIDVKEIRKTTDFTQIELAKKLSIKQKKYQMDEREINLKCF